MIVLISFKSTQVPWVFAFEEHIFPKQYPNLMQLVFMIQLQLINDGIFGAVDLFVKEYAINQEKQNTAQYAPTLIMNNLHVRSESMT